MRNTDGSPGFVRQGAAGIGHALASLGAPIWTAILVASVIATGFVGFGGLRPASAAPAEFAVDEVVRTSLYSVAVLDAVTTDAVEDEYLEAEPGETIVLVTLRIENSSERPIGMGGSADRVESRLIDSSEPMIALADVEPTTTPQAWRTDGSAGGVVLQPDVPDVVQVAWSVPEDAFVDGILRLDVYEPRVTTGQVILSSEHVAWRRDGLVARISVPVVPLEETP